MSWLSSPPSDCRRQDGGIGDSGVGGQAGIVAQGLHSDGVGLDLREELRAGLVHPLRFRFGPQLAGGEHWLVRQRVVLGLLQGKACRQPGQRHRVGWRRYRLHDADSFVADLSIFRV